MYKGELKKYSDKEYSAHMKGADRAFGSIRQWFRKYLVSHSKIRIGKYALIDTSNLEYEYDKEYRNFISWCEEYGLGRDPEDL